MPDTCRLYTDLAWLWPLWGDATTEYARCCQQIAHLARQHAQRPLRSLFDIGCGGGKNILNLKPQFRVTGLDISPVMIAQAKALNPECEFIVADMRAFHLGQTFDVILMDDAISHMNCRADFTAAFRAAFEHLEPGGVLFAIPDMTTETFRQNHTVTTTAAGQTGAGPVEVVFIENAYDPDPADEHYEATILYLIRQGGALRVESDHWTLGLFSIETWRQTLIDTGFTVHESSYTDGDSDYTMFTCVKPANLDTEDGQARGLQAGPADVTAKGNNMTDKKTWEVFFDAHAPVYMDNVFTKNTVREVDFLLAEFALPPGASILDVGCGTGRHSIELAKRGYAVTGVDLSAGMLAQAAQAAIVAGVKVNWIQADATQFTLPATFDASICLCEGAFGLLSQADDPIRQPLSILRNISRSLKPQAKAVLSVLNAAAMIRRHSNQDIATGQFDPVTMTESAAHPPREGLPAVPVRERSFVPTELVLLCQLAGLTVLNIWGGTAGNWGKRPIDLDEIEIMLVARKTGEPSRHGGD